MITQNENVQTTTQDAKVAAWWEAQGKAMWDARTTAGEFLGHAVWVIRFTHHNQAYMPFVIVRQEKDRITLTVGGLIGRSFEDYKGQTRTSISTYSSSDHSAATLEEALYQITH